jgi:hypothetical protein
MPGYVRGVAVASDAASERVEELQFTFGEGPCMEAFSSRRPVLEAGLGNGGMSRWLIYSAVAYGEGVRAFFAFPLQVVSARLGVLDLYCEKLGSLTIEELSQALSFADLATTMLLDAQCRAPMAVCPGGWTRRWTPARCIRQRAWNLLHANNHPSQALPIGRCGRGSSSHRPWASSRLRN